MLTHPDALPDTVDFFLAEHEYEIGRADVFGGMAVVSEGVRSALYDAVR